MARKRTETATKPSKEIKEKGKFTRANKCIKKTTKNFHDCGLAQLQENQVRLEQQVDELKAAVAKLKNMKVIAVLKR